MKLLPSISLLLLAFLMGGHSQASAQDPRVVREEIEWLDVWVPGNSNRTLPKVLLVGDSIARGYYGEVEKRLQGKAIVARLTTSKSLGDPGFLGEVELILSQTRFDLVHFNNGLHGWGYSEGDYEKAFPDLTRVIRKQAPKAKLIWATTTPMRIGGNLDSIQEKTQRVKARNEVAAKITAKEGIPTNDLFSLVRDKKEWFSNDGVHFNPKGNTALGEKVATTIVEVLGKK